MLNLLTWPICFHTFFFFLKGCEMLQRHPHTLTSKLLILLSICYKPLVVTAKYLNPKCLKKKKIQTIKGHFQSCFSPLSAYGHYQQLMFITDSIPNSPIHFSLLTSIAQNPSSPTTPFPLSPFLHQIRLQLHQQWHINPSTAAGGGCSGGRSGERTCSGGSKRVFWRLELQKPWENGGELWRWWYCGVEEEEKEKEERSGGESWGKLGCLVQWSLETWIFELKRRSRALSLSKGGFY